MTFRPELIDELLKDYKNVDDLMGQGGIFKQLSKALIERCLTAELDTGPLYAAYDPSDRYHAQAIAEVQRLDAENCAVILPYPVMLETHSLILK